MDKENSEQISISNGFYTGLPTVRASHDELSLIVAKWLKKHSQNILIPNCATIAVDMKTIEQDQIKAVI